MIIRLFFKIFSLGVYYQIYGKEDDEILIRQNGLSPDEVSGTGMTLQRAAGCGRWRAGPGCGASRGTEASVQMWPGGSSALGTAGSFGKDWQAMATFLWLPQLADPAGVGGTLSALCWC